MTAGQLRGSALPGHFGALALMVGSFFLSAPPAPAAQPSNDNFAEREVLSGSLPIEVTRSNVDATNEEGEFIPGLAPAGHSVWFEWEATSSDWVTIGACDDEFPTILAVFTGTELEHLTPVASGNANEGPDCLYQQRQFTFKATGATRYVIAVDGNSFHLPEAPAPVTEGTIVLRIEATPPPPNDDFADSTVLEGAIAEEPGGARHYFASTTGYNWKATTEPGEPFHGTNSGASVWYSWTAPESGRYRFNGACCGAGLNWGLYVGNSVGELSQMLAATGFAEATLTTGTTYRIGIYGTPDSETEEPSMTSFSFSVSATLTPSWLLEAMERPPGLPADAATEPSERADTTPPNTRILKRVLQRRRQIFVFRFRSSEPKSTFRCKLDKQRFRNCPAHKRFKRLKPGHHVLKAFAVDAAGNRDPSPAIARFRARGTRKHHRLHKRHRHRKAGTIR